MAGWRLGDFGHRALPIVPSLIMQVKTNKNGAAASALGRIDPATAVTLDVKFWRDMDPAHPHAVNDLKKLISHPDPHIREAAQRALNSFDSLPQPGGAP